MIPNKKAVYDYEEPYLIEEHKVQSAKEFLEDANYLSELFKRIG